MNSAPMVYIVDDDTASRESACALIQQLGFRTKTFPSAEDFLAYYDGYRPACLLTDHRMDGMTGVELIEYLRGLGVTLAAVIMTAYADTALTVRAIRSGAITLIEKPFSGTSLWKSLHEALAEDRPQHVSEQKRGRITNRLDALTEGEMDVVRQIVQGRSNKAVATDLDVSIRTIENRRKRIYEKMNIKSVAELVQLTMIARPEICIAASDLDMIRNPL